jgi:hypothetical protein
MVAFGQKACRDRNRARRMIKDKLRPEVALRIKEWRTA